LVFRLFTETGSAFAVVQNFVKRALPACFCCHAYQESLGIGTRPARGCLARTRIGGHDKFLSVGIAFVLYSLLVLWGTSRESTAVLMVTAFVM